MFAIKHGYWIIKCFDMPLLCKYPYESSSLIRWIYGLTVVHWSSYLLMTFIH